MKADTLQIYLEQISHTVEKDMNAIEERPAKVVALLLLFHRAELFVKAIIKLENKHQLATCTLLRSVFEITIQAQYISIFDNVANKVAERYLKHEAMEKFRNLLNFSEFYEHETLSSAIKHYESNRDDILYFVNKREIREIEKNVSELKGNVECQNFSAAIKNSKELLKLTKSHQNWRGSQLPFEKMKNDVLDYHQNNPDDTIFHPLALRLLSKISYSVFGNLSTHASMGMNYNFFNEERWVFEPDLDQDASSETVQTFITCRLLQQALFRVGILTCDINNQLDESFNELNKRLIV